MSNILYIGPYREFSGMGNAARKYIKALLVAGHNIGIRPIFNTFKTYPENDIDYEILELESNVAKPYDIVIQHCYPHQLNYDHRFNKNIGIIHLEAMNYYEHFIDYINTMDEVIVGSNYVYKSLVHRDNLRTKIKIVPEPIDIEYLSQYQNNNISQKRNNYSFYVVADLVDRKNIYDILKAYIMLYDSGDNVDLVLKLKNYSSQDINIDQVVEYEFSKIYGKYRKNNFKKPQIVFGDTNYESLLYIHNNNDCLINISSGESFGYSALEALCFNNNVITTKNSATSELLGDYGGLLIDVNKSRCEESNRIYYMYNSHHQWWYKPDLESLMLNMDMARNESLSNKEKRINYQNSIISNYSINTVAKQLMTL